MDKLLAMKMFAATVDAQGFSAAARKLGLATDADVFQYAIAHGLVNASQQARANAAEAE